MSGSNVLKSGKTHRDENFPVASRFVARRHRAPILAFYRFARAADDIADHPDLEPAAKLKHLDDLEATLFGEADAPDALPLRGALAERRMSARHACDLLAAFRLDVTKTRYRSWDELIGYCELSAMPVGRFVLDVHRERQSTWEASDALCAALQVINHLQDCGKDHKALDRVYLPLDALSGTGAQIEHLARPAATPELRAALKALAERTQDLLARSAPLCHQVRDGRLSLEIAAIQRLAEVLTDRLLRLDPLSQRVHLSKAQMALVSGRAMLAVYRQRKARTRSRTLRGPKA